MSPVFPPSTPEQERLPEDLDGLLHDYFQAVRPKKWPAPPIPQPEVRPGFFQIRSRFTLAASVIILLAGSFWLSSSSPQRQDSTFRLAPGAPTEASRPGPNRLQTVPLDSTRDKRARGAGEAHHP
jgi:hypothetical protein